MKKQKKPHIIYFVLYLIVITEILLVMAERDEAVGKAEGIVQEIIPENYTATLDIDIPKDTTIFKLSNEYTDSYSTSVVLVPKNLVSKAEYTKMEMFINIDSTSYKPPNWPMEGIRSSDTKINKYYSVKKKGNYFLFTIKNLKQKMVKNGQNSGGKLLEEKKLIWRFKAYFKTPRILDPNFAANSQEELLLKIDSNNVNIRKQFLSTLPDSNKILNLKKYLYKSITNKKDTIKFYKLAEIKHRLSKLYGFDKTSINNPISVSSNTAYFILKPRQ